MNIYDIAKLANVSIATVSRVVNDSPRVSNKTKEKVLKIMQEQGYTPNVFARGLGLGSMKTIGIVCPSVADIYMAKAVGILEEKLKVHGYQTLLVCSGYHQEEKENSVELMIHKKVDALILIGSTYADCGGVSNATTYIKKAAGKLPIFLVNGSLPYENVYSAYCDDYQVVYDVTKSMIENQHQDILFLYNSSSFSANQKMKGYEHALLECGIPIIETSKIRVENDIEKVCEQLLMQKDMKFNGIIAVEDGIAIGVLKYAKRIGKNVPEDINIVGYNNSIMAQCCEPEISSIDSAVEELCVITVEHVLQLLEKNINNEVEESEPNVPLPNIHVSGRFIQRGSTNFRKV